MTLVFPATFKHVFQHMRLLGNVFATSREQFYFYATKSVHVARFTGPRQTCLAAQLRNLHVWRDSRVILSNQKSAFTRPAAGNLICCKTGLNGAGKTRNITFCSNDSKQVARYCCPFYRSPRRNWLVKDCIFWWFKSSLLAMGRSVSSHKLQMKPFILHTLRICTLRALRAYSKVLD